MRRALPLGLTALVAACSGTSSDYNSAAHVDPKEARAQAAIDNAAAAVGPRAAQREGLPVSTPTPSAARNRALPIAFQGYWGLTPGDCDLRNVDAEGRISIDGDTIRFHEAKARVEDLNEVSPTEIETVLRFSGEGQSWPRTTRLVLADGTTHLLRSERETGQTMRYQKC